MPHMRFNWVDILFVTLLIRICYVGFKNGFLPEFFRLLGLLIAFIFSFNAYTLLSRFLSTHARWTGPGPDVIAFLLIFLLILFIFKMLAIVAAVFLGSENISGPSRTIGLVLGFGRGILLTSLIYILLVNSPFRYLSNSAEDRSFSGPYISGIAYIAYKVCSNFYPWETVETPLVRMLKK